MAKQGGNLLVKLGIAIIIGILLGLVVSEPVMALFQTIHYILGQLISFCVPLVIVGFIAPAITEFKVNASKIMGITILLAYLSSIGAATFATVLGYLIVPHLSIATEAGKLVELPKTIIELNIPPIMSVMSALVLALLLGLATVNTKSATMEKLLKEFQNIVLDIINKVVIPALPVFIATTFAGLAYEGTLTKQLPVFIEVVIIVILAHYVWLALLYSIGGAMLRANPWNVIKHYGPAYLTALGTMSSAATLSVALECIHKNRIIPRQIQDFVIPLCNTVHLCGSVLTETFFVMTISKMIYGSIPPVGTMVTFILLLGVFAVGAPGVPGGTVMASLGLVTSVLGFDQTGVGLLLSIFALQDSFGTACNVTGDGAIAMMVTGIMGQQHDQSSCQPS
ncbi:MAG: dicarboxylate/amino acid:cation symporter [Firmicutes bacterium]|nr:dicarboxylate/amino acid:cation symporter [Bacillota bacterium]